VLDVIVWAAVLAPPAIAFAASYFLRRRDRRRWTKVLFTVVVVLGVAFGVSFVLAAIVPFCVFNGCSEKPAFERIGGEVLVLEWLLLVLLAIVAVLAAVVVLLTGRDLRRGD
jgi:formate hydrogenlyase subunit 3/multisubunit Na+/H+ antiporter MnhD subunit